MISFIEINGKRPAIAYMQQIIFQNLPEDYVQLLVKDHVFLE
jgi:hypothetical protein